MSIWSQIQQKIVKRKKILNNCKLIEWKIFSVERLSNLGPDDNAELYGGQFQGDIVIPLEDDRNVRTGLRDTRFRWTNNVVPYLIREEDFGKWRD